jgi:hypothetical protein
MKRLLSILSVAAGLLLGAALPQAAHAQAIQTKTVGGVTCSQYSAYNSYPKTFWDCINPANPTAGEYASTGWAYTLPTAFQTIVQADQLYLFSSSATYLKFFPNATVPDVGAMGATTTNVAAAFAKTSTGLDVSSYYGGTLVEQLGHFVDVSQGTPSTNLAVFTTALAYDIQYMNSLPANTVWPNDYQKYPGLTNFAILGKIYGNPNYDIWDFQFAFVNGGGIPDNLRGALTYMPNTKGVMSNVFANAKGTPRVPATANAGVLCVQNTGYSTWPTTFWDCVHPFNATASEQALTAGAYSLPAAFKTLLNTANIQLYIFELATEYNDFEGKNIPVTGVLGVSDSTLKVSAAFTATDVGGVLQDTTSYFQGTIAHELGHQLDIIWNRPSDNNAAWKAAIAKDVTAFNALPCATAIDSSGSSYCTKYAGNSNWTIFTTKLFASDAATQNSICTAVN